MAVRRSSLTHLPPLPFHLPKVEESDSRAVENRETHLQNLRDRLKAREERGRQVRERKQQQAADGDEEPEAE